ncbi:MAG: AAA family ATPase [Planctomycetota bacterium]|jgi:predicted ATPase
MGQAIRKLTIKGYKSIRSLEDFELRNLNILIGPNGAGKSNFVEFFRILEEIPKGEESLQRYVSHMGGADKLLFLGAKVTPFAKVAVWGDDKCTHFELKATTVDKLEWVQIGATETTGLDQRGRSARCDSLTREIYEDHKFYHFHDTSDFAAVKRPCSKRDYEYLRPDASNLAAFLLRLKKKHPREYSFIREVIQLAAPFFDDFWLREEDDQDDILLEWRQKGSDYPFHPSQISDGTLRFICLATALLQPNPPSTILLDEPELGLHPYALTLLAELIQKASRKTQIIVSTQSAPLIDHFEPEDVVVVERENGESIFRRLKKADLQVWLEDYSLGDLWQRNVFGGRPTRE